MAARGPWGIERVYLDSAMSTRSTITRFAPSPTGHLHIGGVRTALFCWAYARRHGGSFMLRVEDTDLARSSEAATKGILEDLAWLGIDWDEGPELAFGGRSIGGDPREVGPFYQSQRKTMYDKYIQQLIEAGRAYPAFDTAEELAEMRAEAQAKKETFRYQRSADYDHAAAMKRAETEEHVIRFLIGSEPVHVTDDVLGEIRFTDEHFDDLVIRKRDGMPTYHFAVVVDDELMGVTHVLRGQEHLNNTPRHVALQKALGFRTPVYAHLPLIVNPDGSKMGKRDKDKAVRAACREKGIGWAEVGSTRLSASGELTEADFGRWLKDKTRQLPTDQLRVVAGLADVKPPEIDVDDFRRSGYLPEVLCNYVSLLGWNPGEKDSEGRDLEKFDVAFVASRFGFNRIGKSHSKFDRAKLLSFNQDAIGGMGDEEFALRWRAWCDEFQPETVQGLGERFEIAAAAARPRAKTLADARDAIAFALVTDEQIQFDDKAVAKVLHKNDGEGLAALRELQGVIGAIEPFEPVAIESAVNEWCERRGIGMGKAAQPLRIAATGGTVSPGLGQTLALVGKNAMSKRIRRTLDACAL